MSFRYVRQLDVPLRHFERYHKQVVGSALVAVVDFELLVVAALVVAVVVVLVGPVVAVVAVQHLNEGVVFSAGWLLAGSELSTDFDVLSFSSLLMMIGLMKKMAGYFASTFVRFLVLHHP